MNAERIIVGVIAAALGATLVGCKPAQVKTESTSPQPNQNETSSATSQRQTPAVTGVANPDQPSIAKPRQAGSQGRTATAGAADQTGYDNAKQDFHYGPGQAWPTLVIPVELRPGPLAQLSAPEPVIPVPLTDRPSADKATPEAITEADPQPVLAQQQPVTGPCASQLSAASLDLGPKENWLSSKLKTTAMGALSKMLFGGSGGDDVGGSDRPSTVSDPIPKSARQAFHDELSDIEMSISGRLKDDSLLLSTDIGSSPDKSTFHAVYLESKDCQRTFPDRYLNYRMWVEWSLSVSWTKTERRYKNDKLVSEKSSSGGFFKSGEYDLAKGSINLNDAEQYQRGLLDDLPAPIWQQMGFSSPSSGVRGLGSQFKQVDTANLFNGDSVAVVHVTRVVDGRYVTRALPFKMERGSGELLKFSRL
ncbi:hypothetical protein DV711_02870 [Motiliproteus coralliicola]|uniref:Uncharacterized protein n=1 Tax=Motiliproteus coralliicola TaxID=2283196 RepID=A0A369WSA4_9GAMM|nr:hypothetical protein [Motiliproteus coralliicola]RDE24547.1 hypothetical protein DV711_02870 [Motiliproteus coralliicola]